MEELPDLRIHRPYASLDDYLEGDFWTVDRKEMFLIGVQSYDIGVAVRFTIAIEDGTPVVTGEGRVVEYTAPSDDFPGGLKVRFRQLDADAKAVLRRALEVRRRAYQAQLDAQAAEGNADAPARTSARPPARASAPPTARTSAAPAARTSAMPPAIAAAVAPVAPPLLPLVPTLPTPPMITMSAPSTTSLGPDLLAVSIAPARPATALHAPPKPRSGMRGRAKTVSAPPDRDALLGRLRARRSSSGASTGK
ncbi:MAG TPA: hypothetical protein VH062_08585 [Polyangiaceae bacterium]|jgi:hypothetical protein|nr:hypothetical protein [Polyangiaceae bacterium]